MHQTRCFLRVINIITIDYSVLGSKGNLGLPVSRVFGLASREYLTIEVPIGTDISIHSLIPKMGIMTGLFFL